MTTPDIIPSSERLMDSAPSQGDAAQYRWLAKLKISAGELDAARRVLLQGLAAHSGDLDLHIMYACTAGDLEKVCAALEDLLPRFAEDPKAVSTILSAVTVHRAKLKRVRAGLQEEMGVSWEDTCTWPDPEGLERFRGVIKAQNKASPRVDLVLDGACVAICDREWDRADGLLHVVRTNVSRTFADYAAFGAQFHQELDRFYYEAISGLLPPVTHILSPPVQSGETLLLASDPKYFRKFTLPFIAALDRMEIPADLHVHIMGGDPESWRAMCAGLEAFTHVRVGFSAEDPGPFASGSSNISLYCHAIRYVRLFQEAARRQRRMWVLDVDVFVRKDPRPLLSRLAEFDVAIRTNPCLLSPPARIAGGLTGIAPTPRGLEFARRVAAYIVYWKERGTWAWGRDQVALFSTYAYLDKIGQPPRTYFQGPADVSSGEGSDAIFYFPTGVKKYFVGEPAAPEISV